VLEYETLLYEEADGVAWVTLNRPEVHNAFDSRMRADLRDLWDGLRDRDEVRCVVLTGAGNDAFCTGIDRNEIPDGTDFDPLLYEDPGGDLGPKSRGLWKPVIAAVNGIACGGAFYMLAEADFMIAADHATFFDPHVTYGMTAVYEPILMSRRMPFGELMRMTLLGTHERISARRAYEIGLVSEVVPGAELDEAAGRVASIIASQPARAVQTTVRVLWTARDLSLRHALEMGGEFLGLGTRAEDVKAGQEGFAAGRRTEWRVR
jgi:enoyl-CoA hydratase/carnithine racemase